MKPRQALECYRAVEKVDSLTNKGRQCFTRFRHTTNKHKWSFNNVSHAAVSMSFLLIFIAAILSLFVGLYTLNQGLF